MTLLLLHPIGLDRTTWDAVPFGSALAVDLPGHGDAAMGDVGSLDDVADAVVAALGATDEAFDVVGLSLGGMVALHLALRHPSRVRSLVVACAPAAAPTGILLERAEETERLGMDGMLESTIARWFTPERIEHGAPEVAAVERRLLADDAAVIARYWRLMAQHDVRASLGTIAAPTTALAATGDPSSPPAQLREIADGVPISRYVELVGPHMVHLEDPDGFAAAIAAHVRWAGARASG